MYFGKEYLRIVGWSPGVSLQRASDRSWLVSSTEVVKKLPKIRLPTLISLSPEGFSTLVVQSSSIRLPTLISLSPEGFNALVVQSSCIRLPTLISLSPEGFSALVVQSSSRRFRSLVIVDSAFDAFLLEKFS